MSKESGLGARRGARAPSGHRGKRGRVPTAEPGSSGQGWEGKPQKALPRHEDLPDPGQLAALDLLRLLGEKRSEASEPTSAISPTRSFDFEVN